MKIGIVADHRGFKLKQKVIKFLESKGYNVIDYSPKFVDLDDYTDHAFLLGEKFMNKEFEYGIAICGNGVGMSIACNKIKGVRCGKVDSASEAKHAREEDDINIIAIGTNKPFYTFAKVKRILNVFLNTQFSTKERYKRRKEKLSDYEGKNL